ncbi:MAG TPA: hypothetical protein VFU76_03095 [Terriglobales bacterium]|nr:hypothetical protein [Terriglobales bacterium]
MPILFMGLMALALLAIMGGLLFFAVYKETHEPHQTAADKKSCDTTHVA